MKTSPNVAKKTLAISMDYSGSGDKWKGLYNPQNEGKDYTWYKKR